MDDQAPHYLLFAHTDTTSDPPRWRVELSVPGGAKVFAATDSEPDARGERLELLAVVRGLEALNQPSRVTLVTSSRYVRRGMAYGLPEWRQNDWSWQWYGQMVPVKNRDLWQRLDGALEYHRVECRRWRFDTPHQTIERPESPPPSAPIGMESSAPDDVQGPARQQVAVNNRRTRVKARSMLVKRAPTVEHAQSAEGLFQHWIERAGLYLLRLSNHRAVAGSGRTGLYAAK